MSTRINTNTTALMASDNLNTNSNNESSDIQELSTGLKINSAADNPAGLVISQNMNAQLTGLNQATSNTNDAINLTKTAEGALNEVQNLLDSMRQLAVAASNAGVNDSTDVAADQAQITSAISSINRISSTTQFGTKNLLDGSATAATTVTNGSATIGGTGLTLLATGTWNSTNAPQTFSSATATAATASSATAAATGLTNAAVYTGSIAINGTTYSLATGTDITGLNVAIKSSGYQATESAAGLTFTALVPGAPTSAQSIDDTNLVATVGASAVALGAIGTLPGSSLGTDASLTLNSSASASDDLVSVSSLQNSDGTSTYTFSNGLTIQAATNTDVTTPETIAGTVTSVAGKATAGTSLQFQIGANAGQTTSLSIESTAADQLGQAAASYTDASGNTQQVETGSVADINVTTFKGAQDAIQVIDKAINDISSLRANLGAFQDNVLQSNANSLSVAVQNLSASKSTITDADLASTVVQYTKDSILVQSATSALSYANQMPQSVLKLLQG